MALRAAQLEMLREGYHRGLVPIDEPRKPERVPPYYWAAFVLSTDRLDEHPEHGPNRPTDA